MATQNRTSQCVRSEHPEVNQGEKQHDNDAVQRHANLHASRTALVHRQTTTYTVCADVDLPGRAESSGLAAKNQAARQIEFWMRDANHDDAKLGLVP